MQTQDVVLAGALAFVFYQNYEHKKRTDEIESQLKNLKASVDLLKLTPTTTTPLPTSPVVGTIVAAQAGNDHTRIQQFLTTVTQGTVHFGAGTYRVAAPINVPDGVTLTFDKKARVQVTADFPVNIVGGNDLRYCFVLGNNCFIDGANIDVKNFAAGGIAALKKQNVRYRNCEVRNWQGVYGICDIDCRSVWYDSNTVTNGVHGLHSYKSTGVLMHDNIVDIMSGGGIFTAWSHHLLAISNVVTNCGDYGIGFEGGSFCLSTGNTIERCKNGELSLYSGDGHDTTRVHNLIHRGNLVKRESTYTTGYTSDGQAIVAPCFAEYGACNFMSVAAGSYEVGYDDNRIQCDYSKVLYHYESGDKSERNVFFTNNKIRASVSFWRCLNNFNLRFTGNEFYGTAGAELYENELRDAHGLDFSDNKFNFEVKKTAGSGYVLYLITLSDFATKSPVLANNEFKNAPGLAMKIDSFNNPSYKPVLRNNDLGDTYTQNGGLSVSANGFVTMKDQRLRLALGNGANDLGGVTAITRANNTKGIGTLAYGASGSYSATSTLHYLSGPHIQLQTGIVGAGVDASASGGTITLSNAVGSLELMLETY